MNCTKVLVPGTGTSKMGESIARFCALAKTAVFLKDQLLSLFLWGCKADVDFNLYMIFLGSLKGCNLPWFDGSFHKSWNLHGTSWVTEDGSGFGSDYLSFKEGEARMDFFGGKICNPNGTDQNFPWRLKTLKLYAPMIWKAKKIL